VCEERQGNIERRECRGRHQKPKKAWPQFGVGEERGAIGMVTKKNRRVKVNAQLKWNPGGTNRTSGHLGGVQKEGIGLSWGGAEETDLPNYFKRWMGAILRGPFTFAANGLGKGKTEGDPRAQKKHLARKECCKSGKES